MTRLLCLLAACSLQAAVDGAVVNRTSGKPQPGATVTLYKLGGAGMESLETVKSDADGRFLISQSVDGPHLLQAAWDGVTYNHMLPPGSPATGVTIDVYNSSSKPGAAKVTTHMILLEPDGATLHVNESVIFTNSGNTSYNDPDGGTLRISLPAAAGGKARVMASAPGGMPIERAAEKTGVAGVYKIDFPVKPGETRFDVTYSLPFTSPGSFAGKVLHDGGPVRVVVPTGVTLKGEAVSVLGQEPRTQASVYNLNGKNYQFEVEGSGALRAPEAAEDEEGGEGIKQIRPRIYDRFYVILGLAFLILLLGFLLLYRKQAPASPPASPQRKRR